MFNRLPSGRLIFFIMIALLTIVMILIARAFLLNMTEGLHEAFNDPNWIDIKEWEL